MMARESGGEKARNAWHSALYCVFLHSNPGKLPEPIGIPGLQRSLMPHDCAFSLAQITMAFENAKRGVAQVDSEAPETRGSG